MIVKVRTTPIDVYYLTGPDAKQARETAFSSTESTPCFTTGSFGDDGFIWDTPEDFEEDYEQTFGSLNYGETFEEATTDRR